MNKKWPSLDYPAMSGTIHTVHLWTQIVGKIRLVKTPWTNHAWHVTLYVSPAGLSTGSVPWQEGVFEIEFDFQQDELLIRLSNGKSGKFSLERSFCSGILQITDESIKRVGY